MHDLLHSLVGVFYLLAELREARVRQLMRKRSEYYIFMSWVEILITVEKKTQTKAGSLAPCKQNYFVDTLGET